MTADEKGEVLIVKDEATVDEAVVNVVVIKDDVAAVDARGAAECDEVEVDGERDGVDDDDDDDGEEEEEKDDELLDDDDDEEGEEDDEELRFSPQQFDDELPARAASCPITAGGTA